MRRRGRGRGVCSQFHLFLAIETDRTDSGHKVPIQVIPSSNQAGFLLVLYISWRDPHANLNFRSFIFS